MYYRTFEFVIDFTEKERKAIINRRYPLAANVKETSFTLDSEKVVKSADNLFYSDNAKLYRDKQVRKCILVIHHGLVYFVNDDDKLLSQNPQEEFLLSSKSNIEDRKKNF